MVEGRAPARNAGATSLSWLPLYRLASKTASPGCWEPPRSEPKLRQLARDWRCVEIEGDGEFQGLGMCRLSSSGSPHVMVDSGGPAPCPLSRVGSGGPGAELVPAGNVPPSQHSEHKAWPLLPETPSLLPPQSDSHPTSDRGGQARAAWNPSLPPLAWNGRRRREMSHGRLCPHSHPQLSQKVFPQSAQAPHIWHTHTC